MQGDHLRRPLPAAASPSSPRWMTGKSGLSATPAAVWPSASVSATCAAPRPMPTLQSPSSPSSAATQGCRSAYTMHRSRGAPVRIRAIAFHAEPHRCGFGMMAASCYTCRYIPRGGFLTDPHEVEQKVPLGGKPASSRAGGGRAPARAVAAPVGPSRTAVPRRAAKPVTRRDYAAVPSRPQGAVAWPRAARSLSMVAPQTRREAAAPLPHTSKPPQSQRPAMSPIQLSSNLNADRGGLDHQASLQSTKCCGLPVAGQYQSRDAEPSGADDMRQTGSGCAASADAAPLQPTSPGAGTPTADGKRGTRSGELASPPSVVVDPLVLEGEAWPGSSAGGSSVGEEGPQVPCLSRLRYAFLTSDHETSASQVRWHLILL